MYLSAAILALAGSMSVGSVVKLAGCLKNIFSDIISLINSVAEFAMTARKQMSTFEFLENLFPVPVQKASLQTLNQKDSFLQTRHHISYNRIIIIREYFCEQSIWKVLNQR